MAFWDFLKPITKGIGSVVGWLTGKKPGDLLRSGVNSLESNGYLASDMAANMDDGADMAYMSPPSVGEHLLLCGDGTFRNVSRP